MELIGYLHIIKKRYWILIITTLLGFIVSTVASFFFMKPVYQATVSLYVINKKNDTSLINYNDMVAGEKLAQDYKELLSSRVVGEAVAQKLGLPETDAETILKKISVNLKTETRFLTVNIRDGSPEFAAQIANEVGEVFKDKAVDLLGAENARVVDKALVPKKPISPKKKINIMMGILYGLMFGLTIILLWEYLDNTLKTPDDIKTELNLPILGVLPNFDQMAMNQYQKE